MSTVLKSKIGDLICDALTAGQKICRRMVDFGYDLFRS